MVVQGQRLRVTSRFSTGHGLSTKGGEVRWNTEDFIKAHKEVVTSGVHNYQGCQISIPTAIRYDRMRDALGNDITEKELRVLDLLKFGMPIDCKGRFGIKKQQKNH